jgi:hypothetical protein
MEMKQNIVGLRSHMASTGDLKQERNWELPLAAFSLVPIPTLWLKPSVTEN